MEPMARDDCSSKVGVQLVPPFSESHTPPEAAPAKIRCGLLRSTSMAVIRPLMPAGPILRNFIALKSSTLNWPKAMDVMAKNKQVHKNFDIGGGL